MIIGQQTQKDLEMNKEVDRLDKLSHACRKTCSGWQDGYDRGTTEFKKVRVQLAIAKDRLRTVFDDLTSVCAGAKRPIQLTTLTDVSKTLSQLEIEPEAVVQGTANHYGESWKFAEHGDVEECNSTLFVWPKAPK